MQDPVDFELAIRGGDGAHVIDVQISQPGSDVIIQPLAGEARAFTLDRQALDALLDSDEAYGAALSAALFADRDVRSAFERAMTLASPPQHPLRLRLAIAPSAARLQDVRWERLTLPGSSPARPLLMADDMLFSRYVESADTRRVPFRPRTELRALLVVANPSDLAARSLAEIKVQEEIAAATRALDPIPSNTLPDGQAVTLDAIVGQLRAGYDILYLVCHGGRARDTGETLLLLENEQRAMVAVPGSDLVRRLSELSQPPRLIVLASCQSAGPDGVSRTQDNGSLSALGPRLAESGIGAVVAMQGKVLLETVSMFMPVFFSEFKNTGYIDRAVALARTKVRNQPDWWMPTLFMRLRQGRMAWYDAGFRTQFNRWGAVLTAIRNGRCTPILGPGVTDHVVGGRRETARRLAEAWNFPLARHAREDLPQVAQYLKVTQSSDAVPGFVLRHLCLELKARFERLIPDDAFPSSLDNLSDEALAALYERLIELAWRHRLNDPNEALSTLAKLNCPLYVTTNPDELLHKALAETMLDDGQRKAPQSEIAPWKEDLSRRASIFDPPTDAQGVQPIGEYRLDVRRPVIYKLFGTWTDPASLVITEDDYFEFLIGVSKNKDLIPKPIRGALANTALLFLGFQLDDWDFRVLFKSLITQEGWTNRNKYAHVAVQIEPDADRVVNAEQARQFLTDWYGKSGDVSVFWGTVQDFVTELDRQRRLPDAGGGLFAARG